MLEGLDPHSTFLDEKDYKDLKIGTRGEFGGLGIEVTMEDGFVKVITPIDDTPAFNAGVKAGDLVIKIDDKSVQGLSLSQAVDLMRGKIGTAILLTIARDGEGEPLEIKIIRDTIKVKSVKYEIIDDSVDLSDRAFRNAWEYTANAAVEKSSADLSAEDLAKYNMTENL